MLLGILEIVFGVLFAVGVVTQLIWPLLTDAPLFPWFAKRRSRSGHASGHGPHQREKAVDGKIVAIQKNHGESES